MTINACKYSALAASIVLLTAAAHAQQQDPQDDAASRAEEPLSGEHSTQEPPEPERRAGADDESARGNADADDEAVRVDPRLEDTDSEVADVARPGGDDADPEEADAAEAAARRDELRAMAEEAVARLERSDEASAGIESAHGYAVFDTTKAGLIVTGAGGSGVALQNDTDEETFMHMGTGGVGIGAGLENYKLILVFEDGAAFEDFVDGQWDAGVSAQAAAGEESESAEVQVLDDVEVYRIDEDGLIAQADITGTRFWPSEKLNEPAG